MKVATWNVNGIRARHEQFVQFVASEQPDVVCLQEIKAKLEQIPQTCSVEGYTCYWHGAGGYSGVALHIRRAFAPEVAYAHPDFDLETRIVQAQIEDTVFTSVYVPNGGKDFDAKIAFIHSLIAYAADLRARGLKLVLCGDMNIARSELDVHPKERKPRAIGQLPMERELFEELLRAGNLVDVGRMLHPDANDYFSWWAPWRQMRERNIGWRLDYVLASEPLAKRATACPSHREIGTSDHAPVVAHFS
ncbi:MAG: exodeoxyribonuclease III [Acidobacteria bacterium]|nr:exodeoxyribonuclease III [Acidobacteriota bacterium]MBV9475240.1 exodeoxyribonuclease III [Acidobacteriota bacterium]